jgi:lipopolysaccharide biosynthesis protein
MQSTNLVRLIAFYFPQFHAIPENDEWWGNGFTDWVNVKGAQPQYPGHYQPRVPLGHRYYDQSHVDVLRWQVDLAKRHGVSGFCHYHYWFGGKQLLQTPTNLVLENKDIDLPFCLCWANETWSRRWDGRDHHILQEQTHTPDPALWRAHFEYLSRAWSDDRAIKINGRPLFLIYRAHRVEQIAEAFRCGGPISAFRGSLFA